MTLVIVIGIVACQKESPSDGVPTQQASDFTGLSDRSTYIAPNGWIEVPNTAKKGCKLFKNGSHFMQVIELDKGAKVEPYAYPVQVNSQNQPTGSAVWANVNIPNPSVMKQPVSDWWLTAGSYGVSTDRLYSITNATFFDPQSNGYNNCGYACKSVYPVKRGSIVVCGFGGSPSDLTKIKRAFVVSSNGQTPNVIGFSDSGSNPYAYNTINSVFSTYKYAVVGFKPSEAPNYTGAVPRTAVGVSGSNVYIFTSTSASGDNTVSIMGNWGVSEAKVVMLDGSASTQLTVLGVNKITYSRCVPSILNVNYGPP